MLNALTDEYLKGLSTGNVGQITENEEDNDVSCVFVDIDWHMMAGMGVDSVYFTRSDLFKLLAKLEESNER